MPDAIRLVQTADLHLGSPFTSLPEKARILQQEQWATFWSIIDRCRQTKADLLLIAGDLFDRPVPEPDLVRQVCELLGSLSDTRILIVPGNHDPAVLDSPYRTASWPPQVTIFLDQPAMIEWPDWRIRVYGIGFAAAVATEPLLTQLLPAPDPDWYNLLLLHGDLQTSPSGSFYNPVSARWLTDSGLDYAALGHVHQYSGLQAAGQTTYAYPGTPFGRGFDELGPKGILAGTLRRVQAPAAASPSSQTGRRRLDLTFQPVARRQFVELTVDVSTCPDQTSIGDQVLVQMQKRLGESWADHLYRVILTGAVTEEAAPMPALILPRLQAAVFYVKLKDQTSRLLDLTILAGEHTLRGAFVRLANIRIAEARKSGDPERITRAEAARTLGLRAMAGEEVTFDAAD